MDLSKDDASAAADVYSAASDVGFFYGGAVTVSVSCAGFCQTASVSKSAVSNQPFLLVGHADQCRNTPYVHHGCSDKSRRA